MASRSAQLTVLVALVALCGVRALDLDYQIPDFIGSEVRELQKLRAEHTSKLEQSTNREQELVTYLSNMSLMYQDALGGMMKAIRLLAAHPELREHAETVYGQLRADGYAKALARLVDLHKSNQKSYYHEAERHFIESVAKADRSQRKLLKSPTSLLVASVVGGL